MAEKEQLSILKQGVDVWNSWRKERPNVKIDLRKAELAGLNLDGVNFAGADLHSAKLKETSLVKAELKNAHLRDTKMQGADLSHAHLYEAQLTGGIFTQARLKGAGLSRSNLTWTVFREANLDGANLEGAKMTWTVFEDAHLNHATLERADIMEAHFKGAQLRGANLERATMIQTDFQYADLSNCYVYGVSAWDLNLANANASNLIVSDRLEDDPVITVDGLELAQFMYLLINNVAIRKVLDTITAKVVLILGRFTKQRKVVLNAIYNELRNIGFVPILFDFAKPASKDVTGTVETIARLSRFIIADLTDPSCIPHELATIIPFLRTTPVLPLKLEGEARYTAFEDLQRYPWVLDTYEYSESQSLISQLPKIIGSADKLADEYRKK